MKQILLSNKNKDVQEYTLVSDEDYEHLKQFKWYLDREYASCIINNKKWRLHRYIMIEILKYEIDTKLIVDHVNNIKTDNTRPNLRLLSKSGNSRNVNKRENAKSIYYGVKKHHKWFVQLTYNGESFYASYKTEEECAYQWDLWIKQYNVEGAKLNNIEKPNGFLKYNKRNKNHNTPKNISYNGKKYHVQLKNYSQYFLTLDEAKLHLQLEIDKRTLLKKNELLCRPILRNSQNQCIIELFNKKKEKVDETIVDEEVYRDLIQYKWYLSRYVNGTVGNKLLTLHRYIMQYTGKHCIDHINGNKLDNRKSNLRIVTVRQNNMNSSSGQKSISKYIGVSFNKSKNKWFASIRVDGKSKHLRYFTNEIDAAKARDTATIKYYGEYGKLNFPSCV